MENSLIVCGGTGAHTAVALIRLHSLSHALGFFEKEGKPFDFPTIYLVDQDAGDGAERPTAWQLARTLIGEHPARRDWTRAIGRAEPPELIAVTPLPIGPNQAWFQRPYNTLESRFESSELPHVLSSRFQRNIDFSKGMMGSPALGSLLFQLKEYDERSKGLNRDEVYGQMLESEGRVVVAASGVGGTGASVGPTVAEQLASRGSSRVMAVMILNWFEFNEDGTDEETRARAQQRNRLMRENAHSALEFYGRSLSRRVAAVPIGMPDQALIKRDFTGDVGQPIRESFVHAVGALSGYRHFLGQQPYRPGLYMMGAVERGRLDGATPIPGGTLQGLANQAATVADLLETWIQTLSRVHDGRVRPAVYEAVAETGVDPGQVADHLRSELEHYRAHLEWLETVVGVKPAAKRDLSREAASRRRLFSDRHGLDVVPDLPPEEVASALFRWTGEWVRDVASPQVGLEVHPAPVGGGQWPDLKNAEGLGIAAELNGDLNRISDANRDAVIEAFVDPESVSANGWPHPLAAADFFRHAIQRRDKRAIRQLELLLVGVVSGTLELKNVHVQETQDNEVSIDRLLRDSWRDGWKGLADLAVTSPRHDNRPIGFVSPFTLFAPVPFMNDDEDYRLWNGLWKVLSGSDDGADWDKAPEPTSWGENDLVIRQILSWMEDQKRVRPGSAPPWMRVFDRHRGQSDVAPYGAGRKVRVYWGASGDAERPEVDIHLPTREAAAWTLPEDAPTMVARDLLEQMPHLLGVEDDDGRTVYSMVELRIPERESPLQGFWDRHLDHLRELGEIHLWSKDKNGAVVLGVMEGGNLKPIRLAESLLLDRSTVLIRTCTPLEQDPVPGSSRTPGQMLYPDLPLKSDYLDLAQLPDGTGLLDALQEGKRIDYYQWRPAERRDTDGRLQIQWEVQLRGLPEPLSVELRLESGTKPHKAHWMVWPRFRTRRGDGWRTYYLYDQTSHRHLGLETLWFDAATDSRLRRRTHDDDRPAHPVAYRSGGEQPAHVGGPPLTVSLRNTNKDEEQGLYLVPLEVLSGQGADVELAVDFGTSHSVAAASVGGSEAKAVEFAAELDPSQPAKGLSLHLSENWAQVQASAAELGVLASGTWLPTYALKSRGMLPSDLVLTEELSPAQADQIGRWEPCSHYMIPSFEVGRADLSKYLLTDFKWNVGDSYFKGQEPALQEHYLALFLELTVAEIVANQARGFPSRPVNVTFTYPLRSHRDQVAKFQEALRRTLKRCSAGMGIQMALKDKEGIFDESRAARLTSKNFGEVCLVGDLGGGTLDLFIAAQGKGGQVFPEVADSARIGGNLLLGRIARSPDGLLPADGNWRTNGDPRDTETKLRAWMRSLGAPMLFGTDANGKPSLAKLSVSGFQHASDGTKGRILLDRYFRLVVEYLARNLTAYLVCHWFPNVQPKDYDRLKISVQLRGNGWRLRYQDETYEEATVQIQRRVRERVLALWGEAGENAYPAPGDDKFWAPVSKYRVANPKTAPILSVVRENPMAHDEVRKRWHAHTLVDLEVERANEARHEVGWWEKIPFKTWGSNHVEVDGISPPLRLTSEDLDEQLVISTLDADHAGKVNTALQNDAVIDGDGMYQAPVAPLVWEAVFDSEDLWPSS